MIAVHAAREAMGYQAALSNADKVGLSEAKKKWYAEQVKATGPSSPRRT